MTSPRWLVGLWVAAACGGAPPGAVDADVAEVANVAPAIDAPPVVAASPIAVTTADFNGDGAPDLAVANYGASTIAIFLDMTPAGALFPTFAAKVELPAAAGPHALAVGDLDGDGRLDLAVANIDSDTVSIFINTTEVGATTLTFAPRSDLRAGAFGISAVALTDLDGDGNLDLVATSATGNTASAFFNTMGSGSAAPVFTHAFDLPTPADPESLAAGDLNGDGVPDLVVVAPGTADAAGGIAVYLAVGSGSDVSYGSATVLQGSAYVLPLKVALGDLDGDGVSDLVIGTFTYGTLIAPHPVMLLVNRTPALGSVPRFVERDNDMLRLDSNPAVGDLDGDGKADLVIAFSQVNVVSVLLGTRQETGELPTFAAPVDLPAAGSPVAPALADFNGDGALDLAIANVGSDSVSVFLDTTARGSATASFAARVDLETTP